MCVFCGQLIGEKGLMHMHVCVLWQLIGQNVAYACGFVFWQVIGDRVAHAYACVCVVAADW